MADTVSHTVAVDTHIKAALPARTSVCLGTPGTWAGSVGLLWMGWSERRNSSCWRTAMSGRNGRGWLGTGRRCGQTALSRRSIYQEPTLWDRANMAEGLPWQLFQES